MDKLVFLVANPFWHRINICDVAVNSGDKNEYWKEVSSGDEIHYRSQMLVLRGDRDLEDAFVYHKTFETEDGKWYFSDSAIIFVDEENQDSIYACRIDTRRINSKKDGAKLLRHIEKKDGFYQVGLEQRSWNVNLSKSKIKGSMPYQIYEHMLKLKRPTCALELYDVLFDTKDYEHRRKNISILTRRLKDMQDSGYIIYIGKEYYIPERGKASKVKYYEINGEYENGSKM